MPISIKKDVKPWYGFGSRFSLRQTRIYTSMPDGETIYFGDLGGSYLNAVRPGIAEKNWKEFHSEANFFFPDYERDVARSISLKFDLDPSRVAAFDELWTFVSTAREYEDNRIADNSIERDLQDAYRLAAELAAGESAPNEWTFKRVKDTSADKLVIFSDHHLTALGSIPDYFSEFNRSLYIDVLNYYAGQDYCVVENGDVEDCLLYVPDLDEAKARTAAAPKSFGRGLLFPIRMSEPAWDEFMQLRYTKRWDNLDRIIGEFQDYYETLREKFIRRNTDNQDRYIRLSGNHDTYLDQDRESVLRDRIQAQLLDTQIKDVLRIKRGGQVRYVVTHGHQFDAACMQHGSVPFAKSLGEIYTECLAWCNQGGDRVWREDDSKRWYIGGRYENALAWERPGVYPGDAKSVLAVGRIDDIKLDSQDFIEELLKRQVAWEYFKNTDGVNDHLPGFNDKADAFNAFALEVWTGNEMYKLRHMDEIRLVQGYEAEFIARGTDRSIPTLVLGHTHEPRQNAEYTEDGIVHTVDFYLNCGSAGRYQNLIWCAEIEGSVDRIVSWSDINGQLAKITWRSNRGILEHESKVVVSRAD